MNKGEGATFRLAGEELVKSLRKAHWLPFYDANGIRETAKEMSEHFSRLHHFSALIDLPGADPQQFAAAFILYQAAFWRNRKCVLAYLKYRMEKLQSLRLQATLEMTDKVKEKLSQNEIKYFRQYSQLIENYNREVGWDITTGMLPPAESLIDVRVLESFDSFEAGKQYFVRAGEVERGILAHKAIHLSTGLRN